MDKAEQRELVLQIKEKINSYEGRDADGVVKGLMWTLYLIEKGKDYADKHVLGALRVPDCRDCGC